MSLAVVSSGASRVTKALINLALARQAEFDEEAQRVYLHILRDTDPALVARACGTWADRPRGEFAPAMPTAADIRILAEEIGRGDEAERRAARVLPLPKSEEDEPRYFCADCKDEPNGWRIFWCHGSGKLRSFDVGDWNGALSRVDCGRHAIHLPHTYAAKCGCYETNPVIQQARERQQRKVEERAAGGRSRR